nr:hypothetical protein [uncultured Cupriavidus sp.]
MTETLVNTVGQSLVAIGLYTVAFESMVLTFRAQMQGYLLTNDPLSLPAFKKACETADKTFKFCVPTVVKASILSQEEVDSLVDVRKRRNKMAHEGYNAMLSLTVEDIEDDVTKMFAISRRVEQWRQAVTKQNPDGSTPFSIAPSIFGLYLTAAQELARTKLQTEFGSGAALENSG